MFLDTPPPTPSLAIPHLSPLGTESDHHVPTAPPPSPQESSHLEGVFQRKRSSSAPTLFSGPLPHARLLSNMLLRTISNPDAARAGKIRSIRERPSRIPRRIVKPPSPPPIEDVEVKMEDVWGEGDRLESEEEKTIDEDEIESQASSWWRKVKSRQRGTGGVRAGVGAAAAGIINLTRGEGDGRGRVERLVEEMNEIKL